MVFRIGRRPPILDAVYFEMSSQLQHVGSRLGVREVDRSTDELLIRRVVAIHCVLALFGSFGCQPSQPAPSHKHQTEFSKQVLLCESDKSHEIIVREIITDEDLRRLPKLTGVVSVEFHRAELSMSTIKHAMGQLPNLKRLRIEGCQVDDSAVQSICGLQQLETLNLPTGIFGDEALASIAKLPKLQLLRFGSPHITDAGLSPLVDAPALRFLHFIHVPISDVGLGAFHGMSQLESFYIDGGRETEDGIRKLLNSNPGLHFHRDQLHLPDDPNADAH